MQKTIVFDFDGTLADTLSLGINILNSYSSKFGYNKISLEQNKNVSAHELISMAGIKLWKLPFLVRRMRKDLNENIFQIQIFNGIPDLLESLKSSGFKMGILSSNSKK
nr:HAD hydrolase-like protein [Treponema sp.]